MAPSVPHTRAAAALRMKQIALDNQGRTIRRLRAQLSTERRGLATMKKEIEDTQVSLEASHTVISELTEIGLSFDWAVKMRIRPPELETSICDAKYHVSMKEPEEESEEEEIEDIPLGEGEIDDE
ncbi:hypothetical protein F511_39000 [Dorcoceras hygrometricum]|uniref:Uncharacterized protein n=1 Tax=Dorcoceras hygrometricum TaxID=472368 RepID=A0A2Z7CHT9_9LAMI|nr:hypothetical protein F511_39000 [Dorcoceras hygrometricum]